jgi:hypothetical protein
MAEAPIYVGNGRKGKWEGSVVIGLNKENLKTLAEHLNENGWVNIIVSPQREHPEKYSVKIDTWKPNSNAEERAEQTRQGVKGEVENSLPF